MDKSKIKDYADQLSDLLMQVEDIKAEIAAVIDLAREDDIPVATLRRIAREMIADSDKLARQYEAEAQLDMFRDVVKIRERKGLVELEPA